MTAWYEDVHYLVGYARWLQHHWHLTLVTDALIFFDDPRAWGKTRLEGDLLAEYESERTP